MLSEQYAVTHVLVLHEPDPVQSRTQHLVPQSKE